MQKLSEKDTWDILKNAFYGVLSTVSDDGTPYGVPLNHVLSENKLYFHSSLEGHKLDNILMNPDVCFTVVGETKMLPEIYTAHFKSVIAFGKIRKLEEPDEITKAVFLLCEKNMPNHMENINKVIAAHLSRLCALEMTIDLYNGESVRRLNASLRTSALGWNSIKNSYE